jgi:thymidylate synthase (FAD)
MKTIETLNGQGSISWLTTGNQPERLIADVAALSHGKHEANNPAKLVRELVKAGHTTPLESVNFVFVVKAPIFVARQWMRHRTWWYNEISRRYCCPDKVPFEFYVPECESWMQGRIRNAHDVAVDEYARLVRNGMPAEQARGVLGTNLMTEFWAGVDGNNLLNFLRLRLAKGAQGEIREYAEAIVELLRDSYPNLLAEFV